MVGRGIRGEGTQELIVRKDEMVSTKLACQLGVDAELLYFGEDGAKVTQYIPNAITMSAEQLAEEKHIAQVAEIFRAIHFCVWIRVFPLKCLIWQPAMKKSLKI